jgi:hypothetical protein
VEVYGIQLYIEGEGGGRREGGGRVSENERERERERDDNHKLIFKLPY